MTKDAPSLVSDRNSIAITAGWFIAGGAITSVFSGSIAFLAKHTPWIHVLAVGMIVPCFTWIVQLAASGAAMPVELRRLYWRDLGRICYLGSVALMPAAFFNLFVPHPSRWISAINVLVSVAIMAADLFRRSIRHGIAMLWPVTWCLTIGVNMMLFLWSSWDWWR